MKEKQLMIQNVILRNTYLVFASVNLLLVVTKAFDYKDGIKDIDFVSISFYLIIVSIATYLFFQHKIKCIVTDNELQIKWSGSRKWYKFPLNSISNVKFNSSRIEINYSDNKKTFTFDFSNKKEKIKVKQFLIKNLESKYQLG